MSDVGTRIGGPGNDAGIGSSGGCVGSSRRTGSWTCGRTSGHWGLRRSRSCDRPRPRSSWNREWTLSKRWGKRRSKGKGRGAVCSSRVSGIYEGRCRRVLYYDYLA